MASLCYTWVWHPPYRSMCCRFHETLFGYTNYLTQAHDGIFKLVSMLAQQQLPWEYKNIWKFTICVQNWAWRIAHNLWYYFFFFFFLGGFGAWISRGDRAFEAALLETCLSPCLCSPNWRNNWRHLRFMRLQGMPQSKLDAFVNFSFFFWMEIYIFPLHAK